MMLLSAVVIAPLLAVMAASDAVAIEFGIPLDCDGRCLLQNYVDRDPGSGVRDHSCGTATYDGHKGVDFRLASASKAQQGVVVRAAAQGVVVRVRDGVEDRLVETAAERAALYGRECGNGVVIDHGGAVETQYCHLRRGSIRVRKGDLVEPGAALGLVGYSGSAAFAHVHFEARRAGVAFDPFSNQCGGQSGAGAWSEAALERLPTAVEAALEAGFAGGSVSSGGLEVASPPPPDADSRGLVFYARFMNLKAGDVIRVRAEGPAGFLAIAETAPLDRAKATFVAYAGKKLAAARWPMGEYRGVAEVVRSGKVILKTTGALSMN